LNNIKNFFLFLAQKNKPFLVVVRELDGHSDQLFADFAKQNKCQGTYYTFSYQS
jgi:hypothetical protein